MCGAGDCFLIETNYKSDGTIQSHLHIILLEPQEHTRSTIVVPVESLTSKKQDHTTILSLGEHEFIKHRSYVNYRRAKISSVIDIEKRVEENTAKKKAPIDTELLSRIVIGLKKSNHTPREVLAMYGYYLMDQLGK